MKKNTRINFAPGSIKMLTKWVEEHIDHPYPDEDELEMLRQATGMTEKQLRIWFTNTRKVSVFSLLPLLHVSESY